jgi:alpha-D-ribose 1-methylphosphonate 5-triphosphate synthase subunit PhnH
MVWVQGLSLEARDLLRERNAQVPLGIDLVLVAEDGAFTCLTRYTRFIKEAS